MARRVPADTLQHPPLALGDAHHGMGRAATSPASVAPGMATSNMAASPDTPTPTVTCGGARIERFEHSAD